ncbi:MAG: DUF1737 domain-containing protein [Solirubrobacteraceae bacterium]
MTRPDDDAFCRRVSEALNFSYELYGSPGGEVRWRTGHRRASHSVAVAIRVPRF